MNIAQGSSSHPATSTRLARSCKAAERIQKMATERRRGITPQHNSAFLVRCFTQAEALRLERLNVRRPRLRPPRNSAPVGLAEQTKEECRIVFRKHIVRETDSPNRWTLQQALEQLCVLLILCLRSRHALSVDAQLADHFWLGLHPIDFNAQHLFRTTPQLQRHSSQRICADVPREKKAASAEAHRGFLLFISCGTCGIQPTRSSY
jgi:hypothetical protein